MQTHPFTPPAFYPRGLSTRLPRADWPQTLLDQYRAAYLLRRAAQTLWQLAQLANWRDEGLTHAYHTAYDALDQVELLAAPALRAWEASHA